MVIGKMIGTMFLSRDVAHKEHLKTSVYAQHMALGDFYDGVIDLADSLAETYQGMGSLIEDIPTVSDDGEGNITAKLKKHLTLLQRYREKCTIESNALENVFDDIETFYLQTLYKLRFLK